MPKTYNQYLTEGINDGTIEVVEVEGIRLARVRAPRPNEEVVGYINFSEFIIDPTFGEKITIKEED